ncbi:uncharacterized protein LOC141530159 [Cotesia typhae]|uniref:uncharacterized protein LOC141530159 n=1 Tax=Cotesia typhae TaxID=2053667 RepID=UPI003D69F982
MWKPANLMEALLPIFVLDCVFFHGVIPYKSVKKLKINYSLFYSVVTLILYVCSLMTIASKFMTLEGITNIFDITIRILRLMYFIITVTITIVGWIFRNTTAKISSDILEVDKNLKSLGISINVQREFCFALKIAFSFIFVFLSYSAIFILYNFKYLRGINLVFTAFVVYHGHHVSWLSNLRFFLLIKHMRLRLKNINKELKNFLTIHNENMTQEETNDRWAIPVGSNLKLDFLHNIRRIHLKLELLCRNITTVYSIPLTLTTITSLVSIICLMYDEYLWLINPLQDIYDKIISLFVTLIMLWPPCYTFLSTNYICQKTANEWTKTGVILDKLELEANDTEIQTEI